MFKIFATNTYKNGCDYIYGLLSKADPKQLRYKHIVIVPDRVSMTAEQEMLDRIGGSFNIRVLTFRRYAAEILPRFNYLNKQAALMTLSTLAEEKKNEFVCYTKGYDNNGFIESIYETVCQLKYSRIRPQDIDCDALPQGVRPKMRDIKLIYQSYSEFLKNGNYVDSASKMEELINAIPNEESVKTSDFYIYDFDNFSRQEQTVMRELAKYSMGVTAVCCHSEKRKHGYLFVNDLLPILTDVAKNSGVKYDVHTEYRLPENEFNRQICEYLYTCEKPEPLIISDEKLLLAQAETVNEEVTDLARYITDGIRMGNRYGDYFAITSDAEKYRQSVERIFPEYGIPFFVDTQTNLLNHAYVRFVTDYFAMRKNNNKLEYALTFAKNPFFDRSGDIFAFENYCLKYNAGYDFGKFELGKNEPTYEAAERLRGKLDAAVKAVSLREKDTVKNYVGAARELIEVTDLKNKLAVFTAEQKEILPRYAKASEQVAEKFDGALQTLSDTLGEKFCGIDEFLRILSTGVGGINISVLPMYNDCVVITNMAKSKKHDIKRLCLLGANQTAMPIVKKDTKLLSDKNIDSLAKSGLSLEQKMDLENKRERFNVYQLLTEPTESLYVSYCESAVQENARTALSPSDFVLQLKRLFTADGKNDYPVLKGVCENVFTRESALEETVENKRNETDKRPVKDPYFDLKEKILSKEISAILSKTNVGNLNNGGELFFQKECVSISKIEDFYSCPYKHYLRYGLDLQPQIKAELNPNDFGSILHAVLEKYIVHIDANETKEETNRKAEKYFSEVMANDYYKGIAKDVKNAYALRLLKTEAVKMCGLVGEQLRHSHFVNFKAEMRFGFGDSEIKAIEVPAGGKTVKLYGIVDRVDVMKEKNRCIVIDYKSGNAEYDESLLYAGKKLQLLVYMCAVMKNFGCEPAGYYYFKLHDKFVERGRGNKAYTYIGRTVNDVGLLCDIDTGLSETGKSARLGVKLKKDGTPARNGKNLITKEQMEAQLAYALNSISRAGELMEKGFIKLSPYEGSCDYCDYSEICGANDIYDAPQRKKPNADAETIVEVMKK